MSSASDNASAVADGSQNSPQELEPAESVHIVAAPDTVESKNETVPLTERADATFGLSLPSLPLRTLTEAEQADDARPNKMFTVKKIDVSAGNKPQLPEINPIGTGLSQYRYLGPHKDTPGLDEGFRASIQEKRDAVAFEREVPLTAEELADIAAIHDTYINLGDELGVDLRDRLPKPSHYHVFASQKDYEADAVSRLGFDIKDFKDSGGMFSLDSGVLFVRQQDPTARRALLAHEAAHAVGIAWIEPTLASENDDGSLTFDRNLGFGYTPVNPAVNEWAADLTAERVTATDFDSDKMGYLATLRLCNAVADITASHHGRPIEEINEHIVRGALNGDKTGLELISHALGDERMRVFIQIPHRLHFGHATVFARQLGISEDRLFR